MKSIIVIGTGGLAREFVSYFCNYSKQVSIVGFHSKNQDEHHMYSLPGKLFQGEIKPAIVGTDFAVICIGNPSLKRTLSEKLRTAGFRFPNFIHPNSVVSDQIKLEEGVVVSPNCTISPNVVLKNFSYLNFGVGVGHDATIGKYVQINPGTQIGGFTNIDDETMVGSGSTILQGVIIGKRVTIASGSVVYSQVLDDSSMIGNPARRMRALEQ
jgi:sugar O-acyltransferase (sialic acid O-acetyltransferase NeuD family)